MTRDPASLARLRRLAAELARDESGGVVSVDFLLTLPVFLTVAMLSIQLGLLFAAQHAVEFAALSACRSAIVWIPADLPGEEANRVREGGTKLQHAHEAAVSVCTAITPRFPSTDWIPASLGGLGARADAAIEALSHASEAGGGSPQFGQWTSLLSQWVPLPDLGESGRHFGEWAARVPSSYVLTRVRLAGESGETTEWDEREDVTAEVEHDYVLRLPIARTLIGHRLAGVGPLVFTMSARVTLTNHGRPHGDGLE